MRQLMLGNRAIARGLYEAGCSFVSSYPGTPSTEITEEAAKFPEIYAEWAPNEKVAAEAALGASIAGARSFCAMKHVGLVHPLPRRLFAAFAQSVKRLYIVEELDPVIETHVRSLGTLLASRLLGNVLLSCGYDVKLSEVHGMSQRGGSVVTHVRYGERVFSPVVDKGEADYLVCFEALEAARWLPYLKKGGRMVANTQTIYPVPVITGAADCPHGVIAIMKRQADVTAVDALALAGQAGSSKAVNVVFMGVLSVMTDIAEPIWSAALEQTVPAGFLELNRRAFALGRAVK